MSRAATSPLVFMFVLASAAVPCFFAASALAAPSHPQTLPEKKSKPALSEAGAVRTKAAAASDAPSSNPQTTQPEKSPGGEKVVSKASTASQSGGAQAGVVGSPTENAPASVASPASPSSPTTNETGASATVAHTVQKATLDLEWEPVEGASAYEVRLTPKLTNDQVEQGIKAEPIKFSTHESRFSESLPVGVYKLQIRSKDKVSGYFGPWGRPAEIEVVAKVVELLYPPNGTVVKDVKSKRAAVLFQWNPIPGALYYTLKVWSEDPTKAQEFVVRAPSKRLQLVSARVYNWEVTFKTKQSVGYLAKPERFNFTLLGPQLVQPIVDRNVGLPHVVKAEWSRSPGAQHYTGRILRHALDETDWQDYRELKDITKTDWQFERLPAGVYRIEVTAHAKNRADSDPGFYEFTVKPTEEELSKALKAADATL